MRVKIVSDGHSRNTKLIDDDTGETIPNVKEITWHCKVNEVATANIAFVDIPILSLADEILKNRGVESYSILDVIQEIRSRNNVNWMDLARLAFEVAPERAREIMRKITEADSEINTLSKELSK